MNPKRAAFVREYITDFNGAQAAIRAGYAPRTARTVGSQLLAIPDIQSEIARLQSEAESQAVASHREVCERLTAIIRTNVGDYLTPDGGINIEALRTAHPEAVQAFDTRAEVTKDGEVVRITKFRLADKIRAIERLSKLLSWDAPAKIAPTTPDGSEAWAPRMTPDEAVAEYMEAMQRAINSGAPNDRP